MTEQNKNYRVTCTEIAVQVEDAKGNKAVMSGVPPRVLIWDTNIIDCDLKEGTIIHISVTDGVLQVDTLSEGGFVTNAELLDVITNTELGDVSKFRAIVTLREEIR